MSTPANVNEPTLEITIPMVTSAARLVAMNLPKLARSTCLYGIPRGGIACAYAVAFAATQQHRRVIAIGVHDIDLVDCFIDDVWDTGKTEAHYRSLYPNIPFFTLFDKRTPPYKGKWLVFPWEKDRKD